MGGLLINIQSFLESIKNLSTTTYDGDLNDISVEVGGIRIYKLSSTCTNGPTSDTNSSFLIALNFDGWAKSQIYINVLGHLVYMRYKSSNWSSWRRFETLEI